VNLQLIRDELIDSIAFLESLSVRDSTLQSVTINGEYCGYDILPSVNYFGLRVPKHALNVGIPVASPHLSSLATVFVPEFDAWIIVDAPVTLFVDIDLLRASDLESRRIAQRIALMRSYLRLVNRRSQAFVRTFQFGCSTSAMLLLESSWFILHGFHPPDNSPVLAFDHVNTSGGFMAAA
jgi:hypothetical protein